MKIVVTGGHHNSALLVAKALKEKGHSIYWFGHKYSMLGDKNPGAEYLEVASEKIPFIEIKAGKFQTKYRFFQNLSRIPLGFFQSFFWLIKLKPRLIVSFGGYLALPVSICGWILGIPVVTHEQTTVYGRANKIIAKIAKKIFVTFPSSLKYFPASKTILTGLPIRTELVNQKKKLFGNNKKTIYISGGKQGSHVINLAVFKILPQLLENFNIIHQCGSNSIHADLATANQLKKELDKSNHYLVADYFFNDLIGSVFTTADFVVSRAGAHTIYELEYLNKPAILIPIPWSNKNEQEKNAKMLEELGLAKIFPQELLTSDQFLKTIIDFSNNLDNFKPVNNILVGLKATEKIVDEIQKLFN